MTAHPAGGIPAHRTGQPSTGPGARLGAPAAVASGGAALAAALLVRDPHTVGSWGLCPFLVLTGLPCPGCGGLRATNDLLEGRVAQALGSNAYAVATAVLVVVAYTWWAGAHVAGRRARWLDRASLLATGWFAGLVIFGVARWLPPLAALQP